MSKYDHIEDDWVKEALVEYKDKIDENKSHRLDISSYRVEKPWGYELWLELNEHYAYKLIHMNKGYQSSLQWHEKKVETNYVIEGEAEVLLQNEDGTMESRTYKAGDGWCLCITRWKEAYDNGVAPPIKVQATHQSALKFVPLNVLISYRVD